MPFREIFFGTKCSTTFCYSELIIMNTTSNPLSTIFGFSAAYFAFSMFNGWISYVPGFTGMVTFMLLAGACRNFTGLDIQKTRDKLAAQIYKEIAKGSNKDKFSKFVLYLRPFTITGEMKTTNANHPQGFAAGAMMPSAYEAEKIEFEERLANAVSDKCLLVALGSPGEAIGAARLPTSESKWQDDVLKLMFHAEHIFIAPGNQPGTIWEIQSIIQKKYLPKSTFFIPERPKDENGSKVWLEQFSMDNYLFNTLSLPFPDEAEKGVLFQIEEHKNSIALETIPQADAKDIALKKLIYTTIPSIGLLPAFKAVYDEDIGNRWYRTVRMGIYVYKECKNCRVKHLNNELGQQAATKQTNKCPNCEFNGNDLKSA